MPAPPWSKSTGVKAVVDGWLDARTVRECFAADKSFERTGAVLSPLPQRLPASLRGALEARGVRALYQHQAEAIDAVEQGQHVVIATPTASGKSLCFHLPVIQSLLEDSSHSALFLYPTKALARDQEHQLRSLMTEAGLTVPATVYDGDTPGDARRAARERCRVVLSNPDMVHSGILPNHTKWSSFFRGLRYVVLDELHTYRGVFGSHMAHVIARLRRVARFYGAEPRFISATATIGNPTQHAARLLGVEEDSIRLIAQSGAPRAERRVFVYNPPIVNAELGMRQSSLKTAVRLSADLVRARVPTILFGPSRNSVEVMLKYLRQRAGDVAGRNAIMGYRGGYLPETRRKIERGLREGEILCVVATNALELGIDIGDLEAVVCAGYPGSIAGTWQRFGRAGRRGAQSIALMVCSSATVDQFMARSPQYLLDGSAEEARIDPSNVEIVIQHLKCATFEAPFELSAAGAPGREPLPAQGERYLGLDLDTTRDALEYLSSHGLVHESQGRYFWVGEAFPATHVSLRNVGWDNFVIVDVERDQSIGELDWRAAHTMLHEQAIYQQDAEQYQVERLDFDNHKAFVRKVEPDYFTTALSYRSVNVLEVGQTRAFTAHSDIGFGDLKVVEKVTGYKKVKFFTHENAGYGDVHLPEIEMHTTGFWLSFAEPSLERLGLPKALVVDALGGLLSALETVATVSLMCDPRDIGRTTGDAQSGVPSRDAGRGLGSATEPTLFLFDAQPGGVGLAERIYEQADVFLTRARSLIADCPCEDGCPACVGPGAQQSSRKHVALRLLEELLGITETTPGDAVQGEKLPPTDTTQRPVAPSELRP